MSILTEFEGLPKDELKRMEMLLEIKEARLSFALDHHVNTRGDRMDFTHFPHIRSLYESVAAQIVLQGSVQSFKAAPLDSLVHTPGGWRTMGHLMVGDLVSTPNGEPAHISQIQPRGVQPLIKFTLDDGREPETTEDHRWKVLRGTQRKTLSKGRKSLQWNLATKFEVLTTHEIMEAMADGTQRFTIPVPEVEVEKPALDVPLDPYFVGLMLGDGEIHDPNIRFISEDTELVIAVDKAVFDFGLELNQYKYTANYSFKIRNPGSQELGPKILRDKFDEIGLLGTYSDTKFIPRQYKESSVDHRLAILQGILDTDGAACDHGGVTIRLASEQLIKDIQEIVWSLGGAAKYTQRETSYTKDGKKIKCKDCYLLNISMPYPVDCFRLERKREKLSHNHRRVRTLGAKIESVEYSGESEVQCIVLNDDDHLYIMDDYVVTHNSEWAIIDHLSAAFCGLSIFFVVPKFETRTTYVQNRINRCVENVPEYKKIMGSGFFDSVALKSFGKGTVKYVGSNVIADFTEFPADMIFVDELDECNQENVTYALDRVRASPYQFRRYLANPREKDTGISVLFRESDQREWAVPCLFCGKYAEMDWFETITSSLQDNKGNVIDYQLRDSEWEVGCGRDVHAICPSCEGVLDRGSLKGRWIPHNPTSAIEGYHISMLCSLINSVSGMWTQFSSAIGDPVAMKHFYNSSLGLPYSAAGSKVTTTLLDRCVEPSFNFSHYEDFSCIVENEHPGPCSMGIDVGKNFDVRISHVGSRGTRKAVFIGKFRSAEEIYNLVDRYNVDVGVIDFGPETRLAQEIQENANCDMWLCRFKGEGKETKKNLDLNNRIVNIDRTEAMDKSYAEMVNRRNLLPENYAGILSGVYVQEVCMPVREIVTDKKGNARYTWIKGKDHHRLADTYDTLAAEMIKETILDEVFVN